MITKEVITKSEFFNRLSEIIKAFITKIAGFLQNFSLKGIQFLKRFYIPTTLFILIVIMPIALQSFIINIKLNKVIRVNASAEELSRAEEKLKKASKLLENRLAAKTPKSYYLIINSASNNFSLFKGSQLIKKDKCSTGSYILLQKGDQQQWMFNTPKGEFRIRGKTTSPVWKKPDWAFVEEGLPVPTQNHHTRFEYGVLGDFALSLGDGYLIHGTLYQRFLGLPVTHGCIRLNDENLELIYKSLSVGSKVYIY